MAIPVTPAASVPPVESSVRPKSVLPPKGPTLDERPVSSKSILPMMFAFELSRHHPRPRRDRFARAVEIGCLTCKTIASLIATHKAARHSTETAAVMEHANLRGPGNFH